MNIADIRKKAQQQKTGNGVPAHLPVMNGQAPVADVEPAIPDIPPCADDAMSRVEPPLLSAEPDVSIVKDFDPLAVIMAGRASASVIAESVRKGDEDAGEERDETSRLLCFRVAGEFYGLDIMEIREIIKPRLVTEVPRMPSFVSGVISLRGVILPVFNMRLRLGHAAAGETGRERIVVINRGEELRGLLVDEVIQVASIDAASMEPPPAVLDGIDRDFVMGVGRIDDRMLILLNLENILDMNLH